jgi:hypothetical protein
MLNQLIEETQYWFQYQQQYILKELLLTKNKKKNASKILEEVSMMEGKTWSYNRLKSYKVVLHI